MYLDLIGVGNEPILSDGYPLFNLILNKVNVAKS